MGGTFFIPPPNATHSCNHQWLLEQTAVQHLSALACNVAGVPQGDLGTSSDCKQICLW